MISKVTPYSVKFFINGLSSNRRRGHIATALYTLLRAWTERYSVPFARDALLKSLILLVGRQWRFNVLSANPFWQTTRSFYWRIWTKEHWPIASNPCFKS